MANYIENVNAYLTEMKIKQSFVCLKSGIDKNKLSRILNGNQEANYTDMEKIAGALGKGVQFFLDENFKIPQINSDNSMEFAFYAGNPSDSQQEFAKLLIELIENMDEIMGVEGRYMM